jgi:hypothetical protein
MKRLLCIAISSALLLPLRAQPVITSNVLPILGDTIIMGLDTILQPAGPGGANTTWDFSSLQQHIVASRIYLAPSATPYGANYPSSTLCRTDGIGSVYSYWKDNPSQSTYYGFVEHNVYDQQYNSTPVPYYQFPITYNSSYTDSLFAVTNPGNLQGAGKYYFEADGWGTLKLPHRIAANVLRTKSILYIGDSSINNYSITREWAWYAPAQKDPLLVISSVIINGALHKKFVFFDNRQMMPGVNEAGEESRFALYPNPAREKAIFSVPGSADFSVRIFNMQGNLVQNLEHSHGSAVEMTMAQLAAGIYIAEIATGNELSRMKMVKE